MRVALITGTSSGMGLSAAVQLARVAASEAGVPVDVRILDGERVLGSRGRGSPVRHDRIVTDGIQVLHAPERHRYEIRIDDQMVGLTQYRLPDEVHVDFIHTESSPEHAGEGLAGQVVRFALDDVRAQGKRIIPHCPYVAGYIRKHPEYEDITDWPA